MSEPIAFDGPMIRTTDLRKTFRVARARRSRPCAASTSRSARGEIFGFLGPNGAGKTTTLRMLATLIRPTSGEAWIAGVDLARDPAEVRRRIGYVPQGGSTDPAETGRGELVLQAPPVRHVGRARPRRAPPRSSRCSSSPAPPTGAISHLLGRHEAPARRRPRASSIARACSSSTSPRPGSTRRRGPGCGTRSAGSASRGPPSSSRPTTSTRPTRSRDRLAIIDHGTIVAEGTSDELKRQVAGDVVTLGRRRRPRPRHRACVRGQPFVREATPEDDLVRLYVDHGEVAMPQLLRVLDGEGLTRPVDLAPPPQPRRRLPAPDRPLAPRRAGRLSAPDRSPCHDDPRSLPMQTLRETWLIFRRSLILTLRQPVWLLIGHHAAHPLPRPLRPAARGRRDAGRRPGVNAFDWFVPGHARHGRDVRRRVRRLRPHRRAALRRHRADARHADEPHRDAPRALAARRGPAAHAGRHHDRARHPVRHHASTRPASS